MTEEKKVTLDIEFATSGRQTLDLPIEEAVTRTIEEVTTKGKWLYLDGKYQTIEDTDEGRESLKKALLKAKHITLAGKLLGG
ncbi:MAG: hypothetical protein GY861_17300 [bacterium]|nr:hypothetical protein [bacterium]